MAVKIQFRRDTAANWTANNPILLSGEIGYETDTNKIKVGNGSTIWSSLDYFGGGGGGGGSGKRVCRYTVGVSTNGWTEQDCDYLCDGTADDVEINAAITSLKTNYDGGEIVFLKGTYDISAPILINSPFISLKGEVSVGVTFFSSVTVLSETHPAVIHVTSGDGVNIENISIVGNQYVNGIHLTEVMMATIKNCFIQPMAPLLNGICLDTCTYCSILNNVIGGSNYYGIYLENCIQTTCYGNLCVQNTNGLYSNGTGENIFGNQITNNMANGLELAGSKSLIANNICTSLDATPSEDYSIYANLATDCIFIGNITNGVPYVIPTGNFIKATEIEINDSGSYYSGTTIEAALQEIGLINLEKTKFYVLTAVSDAYTMDLASHRNFSIVNSDNNAKTLSFSNVPTSTTIRTDVYLTINTITNTATFTHPTGTIWQNASAPTFNVGSCYELHYWTYDGGTTWRAEYRGEWSA